MRRFPPRVIRDPPWTLQVPPELRADGCPSQVWRSLGTSDRKKAEGAYGAKHTEVEALFARWRQV